MGTKVLPTWPLSPCLSMAFRNGWPIMCGRCAQRQAGRNHLRAIFALAADNVIAPDVLGIPENLHDEWRALNDAAFAAYEQAVEVWEGIAAREPNVARIPKSLLEDESEKAGKAVARMRRNYGFDRARNFLPVGVATNVMLVMSARGWVNLCQHLLSHPLREAQNLGEAIRSELELAAPRLLKHAVARDSMQRRHGT